MEIYKQRESIKIEKPVEKRVVQKNKIKIREKIKKKLKNRIIISYFNKSWKI